MGRENKKEAIATLHREQIMQAAEEMFSQKGYTQTTIADISKASKYSRRTIYAYYQSKDDILYHIIGKGLQILKQDLASTLHADGDFVTQYFAVCDAIRKYQAECPYSQKYVSSSNTGELVLENLSPAVEQILTLGTEINELLAQLIQSGKDQKIVRKEIVPLPTVYILWSSITALLTLVKTKGAFIAKTFAISEEEYLMYGLKQIVNSILEEHI